MMNIVVFGDYNMSILKCIDIVKASLFNYGVKYYVNRYDYDDNELDLIIRNCVKKIYIINRNGKISGIDMVFKIRKYDYDSIIIMFGKYGEEIFDYRFMLLNFISVDDNDLFLNKIDKDIIVDKKKYFIFKYKRDVHKILVKDINYVEKESNIKRCIIHTVDREFYITDSLSSMLEQLGNSFCRTHQSCIINLDNVREMKLSSNMIVFNNGDSTYMITNKMKKEVKEYIGIS